MSTPKNFINTGISKKLLTPCRRIGLSRTKKTPRNPISTNLVNVTPNIQAVKTPIKCSEMTELNDTPRRFLTSKDTKMSIKLDKFNQNPLRESNQNELNENPIKNSSIKTVVAVEVHQPFAKRHIDFNLVQKSTENYHLKSPGNTSHCSSEKSVLVSNPEGEKNVIKNRKRKLSCDNGDFNNSDTISDHKKSDKCINKEKSLKKLSNDCDKVNEKCQLKNQDVKSKNISADASNVKDKDWEETDYRKPSIDKTLEGSNTTISLGRFTTEDYLREFSTNPEVFEKSLDHDSLLGTASGDDFVLIKSHPNIVTQSRTEDKSSNLLLKKKYLAIVCPVEQEDHTSNESKIRKTTPSQNKCSLIMSQKCDVKTKSALTVSLEKLPLKSKSCLKDDDFTQYDKLSPTRVLINAKNIQSKLDYADEDELFISSPQSVKQQRDNLLNLILQTENEIKKKEETLVKLKQAQVYKKKHSPEKLNISSNIWLEGCRGALKNLLLKMQEHTSMDMEDLVKKLRIPGEILEKLKL